MLNPKQTNLNSEKAFERRVLPLKPWTDLGAAFLKEVHCAMLQKRKPEIN